MVLLAKSPMRVEAAGWRPPLLDLFITLLQGFPYSLEEHRRRLCRPQLSQFVFKLGKIVHWGCKVFFKLLKAYR